MTIALGKAGKIAATISQAIALGKENLKKIKNALPRDLAVALGKENLKKIKTGFAECLGAMTLGKENSLPSVALGK